MGIIYLYGGVLFIYMGWVYLFKAPDQPAQLANIIGLYWFITQPTRFKKYRGGAISLPWYFFNTSMLKHIVLDDETSIGSLDKYWMTRQVLDDQTSIG